MSDDLQTVAKRVLRENLSVESGETLLVVTDSEKREIGQALFVAGDEIGVKSGIIETRPLERSGQEPPAFVSAAMQAADVVVCPTEASLTHTRAREAATEAGARVATMPGVTKRMFGEGAITANYAEVERLTTALTERLSAASTARVETNGATLEMSLEGREGIPSAGLVREAGESGNIPSGEGYIAPVEGTADGTIVFDGGLAGVGTLEDPLVVHIESGSITSVEGGSVEEFLETIGDSDCARRVGELGLGTNPAAEVTGNVLEDEKIYGTCHVAFGDNHGFGGTIECTSHIDGIAAEPAVYLDDELVVNDGEVLV